MYENCLEEKSELIERISFLEAQHNSENKGNNVVSEEKNVISEDADYDKETVVSSETYQNLKVTYFVLRGLQFPVHILTY